MSETLTKLKFQVYGIMKSRDKKFKMSKLKNIHNTGDLLEFVKRNNVNQSRINVNVGQFTTPSKNVNRKSVKLLSETSGEKYDATKVLERFKCL